MPKKNMEWWFVNYVNSKCKIRQILNNAYIIQSKIIQLHVAKKQ